MIRSLLSGGMFTARPEIPPLSLTGLPPSPSNSRGRRGFESPDEDLSPRVLSDSCSGARPLVFQELKVPRYSDPQVGISPIRVQHYEHSPYRSKGRKWGETWGDTGEDNDDEYNKANGIYALQEKINLLKNHPSEIFNFMVVSGSPRLGKKVIKLEGE